MASGSMRRAAPPQGAWPGLAHIFGPDSAAMVPASAEARYLNHQRGQLLARIGCGLPALTSSTQPSQRIHASGRGCVCATMIRAWQPRPSRGPCGGHAWQRSRRARRSNRHAVTVLLDGGPQHPTSRALPGRCSYAHMIAITLCLQSVTRSLITERSRIIAFWPMPVRALTSSDPQTYMMWLNAATQCMPTHGAVREVYTSLSSGRCKSYT